MAQQVEQHTFEKPDEVREFPHGRVELVHTATGMVGRLVAEPGWRWSEHVKPIAKTDWCEAPHFQYQLAGESSTAIQGTSSRCLRGTTPGSSVTSRSSPSTGTGSPTTRSRAAEPGEQSRPHRRPLLIGDREDHGVAH